LPDKKHSIISSFGFAFSGLKKVFAERNFRIMILAAALVLILGLCLGISRFDWLIIVLCIGANLSIEIINSSVETIVDLVSPDRKPLAGKAKDLAAAASLIAACVSVICGIIIFYPYLST
jgi:diacylglycerol kinase